MANEIAVRLSGTGDTIYAQIMNASGELYNGSAFEDPADANWGNYDLPMTEAGTATRIYRCTMPAVAAGVYTLLVYKQAGASPAIDDTLVASGEMQWDGNSEVPLSSIISSSLGAGAVSTTIEVLDSSGNPIDGVEVWITSDPAGGNVVAGTLVTDAFGNATFMLDAGTYYVFRQKSGINFLDNPSSIVVS